VNRIGRYHLIADSKVTQRSREYFCVYVVDREIVGNVVKGDMLLVLGYFPGKLLLIFARCAMKRTRIDETNTPLLEDQ
jgi:hypothetical protein